MAKCEKCGIEVAPEDFYEDHGLKVCEDCKMKDTKSPSKPCNGER